MPHATSLAARVLRTPLLTKLIVLDTGLNLLALAVMQGVPTEQAPMVTVVSLFVVLFLNAALVAWALLPLRELEETARRVTRGEFDARTRLGSTADANLARIAAAFDALLDTVSDERARVRALAAQVVAAGDNERAHIARELHDGTAQSLSALEMLLSSHLNEQPPGPGRDQAALMRDVAREALEEVRALSHSVHPRALDELGLAAALQHLARRAREQSGVEVDVDIACLSVDPPSKALASVLYRVAQESLHNSVKHARADAVRIALRSEPRGYCLEIEDDGVGFDLAEVTQARKGLGLFVMEERLALVNGVLEVRSTPGDGSLVRARVPAVVKGAA